MRQNLSKFVLICIKLSKNTKWVTIKWSLSISIYKLSNRSSSEDSIHLSILSATVCYCHMQVHTHTHRFNGRFPGKPGLASFPFDSQSPIIHILSILMGQAKTFHIRLDTIPPSLPWTSPLPGSLKFHLHTSIEPVCIILTLNTSKPPQSTSLNCQAAICKYVSQKQMERISPSLNTVKVWICRNM